MSRLSTMSRTSSLMDGEYCICDALDGPKEMVWRDSLIDVDKSEHG